MNITYTTNIILYSTIIWEICNQFICFLNKENRQYNSRYCSNIHALIIFTYSFIYCYIYEFDFMYNNLVNGISVGYLLFDSYRAIKYREFEYIIHHSVGILAICPTVLNELNLYELPKYYHYLVARAFLSESSTIFLNNCWLLIKQNKKNSNEFIFNSIMLLVLFLVFRVVNFTLIFNKLIHLEYYSFIILHIPLTVLNYVWFYKLMLKTKELFSPKKLN
jgi:hypothetical protein